MRVSSVSVVCNYSAKTPKSSHVLQKTEQPVDAPDIPFKGGVFKTLARAMTAPFWVIPVALGSAFGAAVNGEDVSKNIEKDISSMLTGDDGDNPYDNGPDNDDYPQPGRDSHY
ncbi:MAG: hypothetical protein MJ231_03565 [bacterium]|nr:hypothetical protein [bacterium]